MIMDINGLTKMKVNILFNPGPTNVSSIVSQALISPNMNHREPEFVDIMHQLVHGLLNALNCERDYDCVPFISSGTGANEAILSLIGKGKLLVLIAGSYGERILDIANHLKINLRPLSFDPFSGIDLRAVEDVLIADSAITHLCFVHHETTTGVLAPAKGIADLGIKYNVITMMDAISSVFGHDIVFSDCPIDIFTATSNKCLESVPGLSFVFAKKKLLPQLEGASCSYYFDLFAQWNRIRNGDGLPRFTMATQLFYAAHKAMLILLEESVKGRARRYLTLQNYLIQELQKIGIESFNYNKDISTSNVLHLFKISEKISYEDMHYLAKSKGITIYTDEITRSKGLFFLATMGQINANDINYFVEVLKEAIAKK